MGYDFGPHIHKMDVLLLTLPQVRVAHHHCAFLFCDGPRYFPGVVMQNDASGPPGATHAPPSCTRFRRSGGLRIHHHISGLVRYASSCFAGQSTTHQMCAPLFNELVKPLLSSSGGSGTLNSVAQSLPSVSTYHAAADVMAPALGRGGRYWLSRSALYSASAISRRRTGSGIHPGFPRSPAISWQN